VVGACVRYSCVDVCCLTAVLTTSPIVVRSEA
jgi:hypothetical protein